MSNNFFNIFHVVIIAIFILTLSGCGKKGDPVYVPFSEKQTKEVIK
jgi:predicted small lipoprotein YifL